MELSNIIFPLLPSTQHPWVAPLSLTSMMSNFRLFSRRAHQSSKPFNRASELPSTSTRLSLDVFTALRVHMDTTHPIAMRLSSLSTTSTTTLLSTSTISGQSLSATPELAVTRTCIHGSSPQTAMFASASISASCTNLRPLPCFRIQFALL